MSTVNCASCRYWEALRNGIGSCEAAGSENNLPVTRQMKAIVATTGGYQAGVLLTFHTFCCASFARKKPETGNLKPETPVSGTQVSALSPQPSKDS